jgi:hypothetical protein
MYPPSPLSPQGCLPCTQGFVPRSELYECLACEAGTFWVPNGQCSPCLNHTVKANIGPGNCTLCMEGSVPNKDLTQCELCPENTFFASKNQSCEPCPMGYVQPKPGKLSCVKHTFSVPEMIVGACVGAFLVLFFASLVGYFLVQSRREAKKTMGYMPIGDS